MTIKISPEEVVRIRQKLEMTPSEMAKRLGVSLPTQHRWERDGVPQGPAAKLIQLLEYIERTMG